MRLTNEKKTLATYLLALTFGVILLGTGAIGAEEFRELEDSGTGAKEVVGGVIKTFFWVLAFTPVFGAFFFTSKMKAYLENKEEQGQYQPKATKNFLLVAASVIGVLAAFLLIGILGKVFFNWTFTEAWTNVVTVVWTSFAPTP